MIQCVCVGLMKNTAPSLYECRQSVQGIYTPPNAELRSGCKAGT